jgi:hypothetical protein
VRKAAAMGLTRMGLHAAGEPRVLPEEVPA